MTSRIALAHDWFPKPLPSNVEIGERSWLHSSFAFVHYRSRRPRGVRIGHDSGIYVATHFDLGPNAEVDIGNYCAVVGAMISTNGRLVIGDYALISHDVVIADSAVAAPPDGTEALEAEGEPSAPPTSSIVVGENAWIGTRAVLLAGADIGDGAVVGAGAVIDFDVPPYAIVAGNPARVVGWARPRSGRA